MPSRNPPRLAIDLPGRPGSGIVKALDVPAVRRHFAHGLAALHQQFPEALGVIDSAGETAADSDDCDAVFGHEIFKTARGSGADSGEIRS